MTKEIIQQAITAKALELGIKIGDTINLTTILDEEIIASGYTYNAFGPLAKKKNVLLPYNTNNNDETIYLP